MEYDSEKVAMATLVELENSAGAKAAFQELKEALTSELIGRFAGYDDIRISNTAIAIDACHREATKALAASELLQRLGGARRVHVFGDSASDADLAFASAQLLRMSDVRFNYLGQKPLSPEMERELQARAVAVRVSIAPFSKGLLELLSSDF